jgi:hypothetical protein
LPGGHTVIIGMLHVSPDDQTPSAGVLKGQAVIEDVATAYVEETKAKMICKSHVRGIRVVARTTAFRVLQSTQYQTNGTRKCRKKHLKKTLISSNSRKQCNKNIRGSSTRSRASPHFILPTSTFEETEYSRGGCLPLAAGPKSRENGYRKWILVRES